MQEWALNESKAKEVLSEFSLLSGFKKLGDGIYVDYGLDEQEFNGGFDYPDIVVVSVCGVIGGRVYELGEIRSYNYETIWFNLSDSSEVENSQEWIRLIKSAFSTPVFRSGLH